MITFIVASKHLCQHISLEMIIFLFYNRQLKSKFLCVMIDATSLNVNTLHYCSQIDDIFCKHECLIVKNFFQTSVECSTGTYRDSTITSCAKCAENSISEQTGAASCTSCSAGTVSNDERTQCGNPTFSN